MPQVFTWLATHSQLGSTGSIANAYIDTDLTARGLPADTKAVCVLIQNFSGADRPWALRPSLMAWERFDMQRTNSSSYVFAKVVSGRVAFKLSDPVNQRMFILGYAADDSPSIWFDNPINLLGQSTVGVYSTINIGEWTGGRTARAAVVRYRAQSTQVVDFRHPSTTLTRQTEGIGAAGAAIHDHVIVGCSANQFQFYRSINGGADDQLELLGFIFDGLVWNTSPPNINPTATATWEAKAINANARGVIIKSGRTMSAAANTIGVRDPGVAHSRNPTFPGLRHAGQYVMSTTPAGEIEVYRTTSDGANSYFDVQGYFTEVATATSVTQAIPPLMVLGS